MKSINVNQQINKSKRLYAIRIVSFDAIASSLFGLLYCVAYGITDPYKLIICGFGGFMGGVCVGTGSYLINVKRFLVPVGEIIDYTNNIAKGDLTSIQIEKKLGMLEVTKNAFIKMANGVYTLVYSVIKSTESVEESINTINSQTKELDFKAKKIKLTIDQVAGGSKSQINNINKIIADIYTVEKDVKKIMDNTHKVSDDSKYLEQMAVSSNDNLVEQIKRIESNKRILSEIKNEINILAENAVRINDFVKEIKDIAQRTNMLSLNASIEAARSGESGSGFAVVSNSVHKLAQKASNASLETVKLISLVQKSIQDIVTQIMLVEEAAKQQEDMANKNKAVINKIINDVSDINRQICIISNDIDKISAYANDVNRVADEIKQITNMTLNEVEQINVFNERQINLAKQFQDCGQRFTEMVNILNNNKTNFKVVKLSINDSSDISFTQQDLNNIIKKYYITSLIFDICASLPFGPILAYISNTFNMRGNIIGLSIAGLAGLIVGVLTANQDTAAFIKPTFGFIQRAKVVGNGNLNCKISNEEKTGSLVALKLVFNNMLVELVHVISDLKISISTIKKEVSTSISISNDTAQCSLQLKNSMYEVTNGSNTQAAGLQKVLETVRNISGNVENIACDTSKTAQNTSNTKDMLSEGIIDAQKQQVRIIESKQSIIDVSNTIQELKEKANSINEVIKSISVISEETNLLALNAAIESAKAGEQGNSFAVVADEIRILSDSTKQSAEKIYLLLDNIQNKTQSIVTLSSELKDVLEVQIEDVLGGRQVLSSINDKLVPLNNNMINIADSSQSILATMNNIVNETENISSLSEQIASSSEEVLSSVEEQKKDAELINEKVLDFSNLSNELTNHIDKFIIS